LAIGLLGFALVVIGARSIAPRDDPTRVAVRHLMTPLKPFGDAGNIANAALARADRRGVGSGDAGPVMNLAQQAAQIAVRIKGFDVGENQEAWQEFAGEMQRSAVLLAQAAQQNNSFAMLAAARRLDATCVQCHEVFRQPPKRPLPAAPTRVGRGNLSPLYPGGLARIGPV
jgi:hypothetical protein